jgi:hypothetical protein
MAMKDVLYLTFTRNAVTKMTKSQPRCGQGEFFVKVEFEVTDEAFRPPVLVRKIEVADWRRGVDTSDIDMRVAVITEEEAELIRQRRLLKMAEVLTAEGYAVISPEPDDEGEDDA